MTTELPVLKPADYASDQDVRWCPGCGDYSILAQMKKMLATKAMVRENTVFVSGIGCSSRFPYYMNTYGMHSIHGRAPAIASGLKQVRPDLMVWIITWQMPICRWARPTRPSSSGGKPSISWGTRTTSARGRSERRLPRRRTSRVDRLWGPSPARFVSRGAAAASGT